jgi:phage baseplate assembly protein W
MKDELERIRKEVAVAKRRYYPRICVQELRKAKKNSRQESRYPR